MSKISIVKFATSKHSGRFRKYNNEPEINHPDRVAQRAAKLELPGYVEEAAWGHDLKEEFGVTDEELLEAGFSYEAIALIDEVTNPSIHYPALSRADRKNMDFQHIRKGSWEGRVLKLIDRDDNVQGLRDCQDAEYLLLYITETMQLLNLLKCADPIITALQISILTSMVQTEAEFISRTAAK